VVSLPISIMTYDSVSSGGAVGFSNTGGKMW
jgi:hypothetical protein